MCLCVLLGVLVWFARDLPCDVVCFVFVGARVFLCVLKVCVRSDCDWLCDVVWFVVFCVCVRVTVNIFVCFVCDLL